VGVLIFVSQGYILLEGLSLYYFTSQEMVTAIMKLFLFETDG